MLGGYAPLPLRLQHGALDGISSPQWCRTCADLASARRAAPIATLGVRASGHALPIVTWYADRGTGTVTSHPWLQLTWAGSGLSARAVTLSIAGAWVDELNVSHPVLIAGAEVNYVGAVGATRPRVAIASDGLSVTITPSAAPATDEVDMVIILYAEESADPREYGGDDDKTDCTTESSTTPLAAEMLEQIQAARGSSYTTQTGTVVAAENLALARGLAWLRRQTEKSIVQRDPGHAGESLPHWEALLGIDPALPPWEARRRMGAQWIQSMRGPGTILTHRALDVALSDRFGALVVATHHVADELNLGQWVATSPEWWALSPASLDTRWDARTGHWSPDLGDAVRGPWFSQRCHTQVELLRGAGISETEWRATVSDVDGLMDTMTPAWMTWECSTAWGTGYRLDYDRLDDAGLG